AGPGQGAAGGAHRSWVAANRDGIGLAGWMHMQEIDLDTAARALEAGTFNFLRRGADLSLRMSGARWHLAERTPDTLTFRPGAPSDSPSGASPADDELPLALAAVAPIPSA